MELSWVCSADQLTDIVVAELPADHGGVPSVPAVVTDSAPASVETHLHPSLVLVSTSHEADSASGAVQSANYTATKIKLISQQNQQNQYEMAVTMQ